MPYQLFVHIGFHKTGTTWLQERVFSKHPEIRYLGKANDYPALELISLFHSLYEDSDSDFSVEECRELWAGIEQKYSLHEAAIVGISDEGLSGGPDWFGGASLHIAERIREVFLPIQPKIVIGIREQAAFISSFYSEYIGRGGTNSFDRLVNQPASEGRHLLAKAHFWPLIEKYIDVFGRSNVHVYLQEQLRNDSVSTAAEIIDYVGVDPSLIKIDDPKDAQVRMSGRVICAARLVNSVFYNQFNNNSVFAVATHAIRAALWLASATRLGPTLSRRYRLLEQFSPLKRELFVSDTVRSWILRGLMRMDSIVPWSGQKNRFEKDTVELRQNYAESNARLSALLNIDLGNWGYEMPDSTSDD